MKKQISLLGLLLPILALLGASGAAAKTLSSALYCDDSNVTSNMWGRSCSIDIPAGTDHGQAIFSAAVGMTGSTACGPTVSAYHVGATQTQTITTGDINRCGPLTQHEAILAQDDFGALPGCSITPSGSWTGRSECSALVNSKVSTDDRTWGQCSTRKWTATSSGAN